MRRTLVFIFALAIIGVISFHFAVSAQAQAPAKPIIFLSGPVDHGMPGGAAHQYDRDLKLLATSLEQSPNLKGIKTKVFIGKAPRDIAELQDASVIVINSSSDRDAKETHPLFPPDPTTNHTSYDAETTAYLKQVDALTKKGTGIVIFHYAVWAENWVARRYYMDWTGGLWVQIPSKNPMDKWSMTLPNPNHPVLNGVQPWSYSEEVFCNFFLPRDPRRTELLIGTPAKSPVGPQVAAWAFQREDGHRGFVYGGLHSHANLAIDDHRRFLLNGIVWAAGMDVPAGGVQSTVTDEMMKQ